MEVWVTNKQNRVNNTNNNLRNIIAIQDLGESQLKDRTTLVALPADQVVAIAAGDLPNFFTSANYDLPSDNRNNKYKLSSLNLISNNPIVSPFLLSLSLTVQLKVFIEWIRKKTIIVTGTTGIGKSSVVPKLFFYISVNILSINNTLHQMIFNNTLINW
jgi:hypothetical protein